MCVNIAFGEHEIPGGFVFQKQMKSNNQVFVGGFVASTPTLFGLAEVYPTQGVSNLA